jgi:hypothetical protein
VALDTVSADDWNNAPDTVSADDWNRASSSPQQAGAISADDWNNAEGETVAAPSAAGSAIRRGIMNAPVGAAAGVGTIGGAALGTLTDPVTGPAGTFVGGLAGGIGAGMLAQKGEDWILEKLGLDQGSGFASKSQRLADELAHPHASFAGELAGNILPSFGAGSGRMVAQRALGAGLQGGLEAGQEVYQGNGIDPTKVGIATAAGAAFPSFNRAGRALESRLAARMAPRTPGTPGQQPPGQPPPAGTPAPEADLGDVSEDTGQPAQAAPSPELAFAQQQRDKLGQGHPLYDYWDAHARMLEAQEGGHASPDSDNDAVYGPFGDQHVFRPEDADRANDVTTYARGIAAENAPAPQIEGAGNPIGSPMLQRTAQRPSGDQRDYRKNRPVTAPSGETSQPLSTDPVHEDVARALAVDEPQTGFDQQTTREPEPTPPPAQEGPPPPVETGLGRPLNGGVDATIQQATQLAMRRPIVEAPMPSGANSTKDMNGPVVVDPRVPPELRRPVAVHETVEQTLMAQGMPYAQAHKIATRAEQQAVEAAGMNWKEYQDRWAGILPEIGRTPVTPEMRQQWAQAGLHVDPEEAIGHYHQAAEDQAVAGAEQAPVTAAVTPAQQRVLAATREQLKGMPRALQAFDALDPQAQLAAIERMRAELQTGAPAEGEPTPVIPTETTVGRAPRQKVDVEGTKVSTRSKADAERKGGAVKAWDAAVAQFGEADKEGVIPTTTSDKAALVERLKQMVQHAADATGNANPIKAYRPNVKPASYNILKAAQRVIAKPTPANIRDYFAAVRLGKEGAKDLQQTSRIDSDIAYKPQIEEAPAEAMTAQAAPPDAREFHEPFDNSSGDESQQYTVGQNRLRDWLNGLSDDTYSKLADIHPELKTDIAATQDPVELMRNYMDDLAEQEGKRPGKIELVPAEDVKGKPQPVRTAADVDRFAPTPEGGAAGTGKSLKNDPRFAELVAKYASAAPAKKGLRLEALETPEASEARSATVDGSDQSFLDKVKAFGSDESGALSGQAVASIGNWLKNSTSYFSPRTQAQPGNPIKDYGDQLGGWFTRMGARMSRATADLIANLHSTPDIGQANAGQVYRAMERGEIAQLPSDLRDWYNNYIKPIADQYGPKYDELRTLAQKYGLAGGADMPERKSNPGNGWMNWVSRIRKDDTPSSENQDVFAGKTLAAWSPTTQDRDFFALQNSQGQRIIYKPGDGEITIMRNGSPQNVKVSNFNPTDIGATVRLKVKGQSDVWTVDHAAIDEIKAATAGKVQYHDNPAYTVNMSLNGLNNALERARQYRDIVESPEFSTMTATNRAGKDALEAAYPSERFIQPQLPQFKDTWMPEKWAWIMNDYHKRGIFSDSAAEKQTVDNLSMMAAKTFLTFGPQIHTLNEADKWATSRGFKWISPSGWGALVKTAPQAIKAAYTLDPAIYREITEAGGNPMAMHAVARNFSEQAAKLTGVDIAQNPSKWDYLGKYWGMTIPQLADAAYQKSTKFMWRTTDAMYIQRYLEERDNGYAPEDAVKRVEKFIDSYQMGPTIGGSRLAKQVLSDPSVSYFAPYHYGVFRSWGNMAKGLMAPSSTMAERKEAAGQFLVQLALGYAFYPAMSAAYRAVTGEQDAEFKPRGMSALAHSASQVAQGQAGPEQVLRDVWMPGVPAQMAIEGFNNKDWRGQPIVPPRAYNGPSAVAKSASDVADWAARSTVAPYNTISYAANAPGGGIAKGAQRFAEDQLNIHNPSSGELKHNALIDKINAAAERARQKRPGGLIERGVNAVLPGG